MKILNMPGLAIPLKFRGIRFREGEREFFTGKIKNKNTLRFLFIIKQIYFFNKYCIHIFKSKFLLNSPHFNSQYYAWSMAYNSWHGYRPQVTSKSAYMHSDQLPPLHTGWNAFDYCMEQIVSAVHHCHRDMYRVQALRPQHTSNEIYWHQSNKLRCIYWWGVVLFVP